MHTSKEEAEIFRQLAEGFGPSGHPNFFAILVEQLARLLNVDHALVAAFSCAFAHFFIQLIDSTW